MEGEMMERTRRKVERGKKKKAPTRGGQPSHRPLLMLGWGEHITEAARTREPFEVCLVSTE